MPQQLLDLIASRPACAAQHFGAWMVEPSRFMDAISAIEAGTLQPNQAAGRSDEDDDGFVLEQDVAIIPIHGAMTKGRSSYGGTSTVQVRSLLRMLKNEPDIGGIMLHIDSPGGTAAGTPELAEDIRAAAEVKPVHAHADDLMASASAFAGLQASRVTINKNGEAGSFGTVARLIDSSGEAEQKGIKVHVLSTGPYKGAFTPGAPVPEAHLDYAKEMVESCNQSFVEAVKAGRPNLSSKQVRDLFYGPEGGKVWSAERSLELGIVDAIESFDNAMANLHEQVNSNRNARTANRADTSRRRRLEIARRSIDMAG